MARAKADDNRKLLIKERKAVAADILKRQAKIAADLLEIDAGKERLRAISADLGEGFTESVDGLGTVEVKPGAERKFKGKMPVLVPAAWLGLSAAKQTTLIAQGIVVEEDQWSAERKPSVTVRL